VRSLVERARFLNVKEEEGFSLSEMMVTITIMMIVFLALYSLFGERQVGP
jgi:prepilin-type N-terminal cleavage/methylation domain-containing protein